MTDATSRFGPPIDLASEADFILGELHVSPSTREVTRGGAGETLEPRVMQVLVVLAQAGGRVISRDLIGEIIYVATVQSDTNIDLLTLVRR